MDTVFEELLSAYETAQQTKGRPTVVLARTVKGKGLGSIEGKEGWHGKALDPTWRKGGIGTHAQISGVAY